MTQAASEHRSSGPVLRLLIRIGRGPISVRRQISMTVAATGMVVILGWADFATAPLIHLGLLYVVPVLFAAWYGGRWPGYVLNVLAALVWWRVGQWLGQPAGQTVIRLAASGSGNFYNGMNLFIRCLFYGFLV